jgi:hypothetical protein
MCSTVHTYSGGPPLRSSTLSIRPINRGFPPLQGVKLFKVDGRLFWGYFQAV